MRIDEETAKRVENFLKKEYGRQVTQENEPSKPKAIIDPKRIKILTDDSDNMRKALDPTSLDPTIPEKKELLTDIQKVTAIYTAISPSARSLLDRLEKSFYGSAVYLKEMNL